MHRGGSPAQGSAHKPQSSTVSRKRTTRSKPKQSLNPTKPESIPTSLHKSSTSSQALSHEPIHSFSKHRSTLQPSYSSKKLLSLINPPVPVYFNVSNLNHTQSTLSAPKSHHNQTSRFPPPSHFLHFRKATLLKHLTYSHQRQQRYISQLPRHSYDTGQQTQDQVHNATIQAFGELESPTHFNEQSASDEYNAQNMLFQNFRVRLERLEVEAKDIAKQKHQSQWSSDDFDPELSVGIETSMETQIWNEYRELLNHALSNDPTGYAMSLVWGSLSKSKLSIPHDFSTTMLNFRTSYSLQSEEELFQFLDFFIQSPVSIAPSHIIRLFNWILVSQLALSPTLINTFITNLGAHTIHSSRFNILSDEASSDSPHAISPRQQAIEYSMQHIYSIMVKQCLNNNQDVLIPTIVDSFFAIGIPPNSQLTSQICQLYATTLNLSGFQSLITHPTAKRILTIQHINLFFDTLVPRTVHSQEAAAFFPQLPAVTQSLGLSPTLQTYGIFVRYHCATQDLDKAMNLYYDVYIKKAITPASTVRQGNFHYQRRRQQLQDEFIRQYPEQYQGEYADQDVAYFIAHGMSMFDAQHPEADAPTSQDGTMDTVFDEDSPDYDTSEEFVVKTLYRSLLLKRSPNVAYQLFSDRIADKTKPIRTQLYQSLITFMLQRDTNFSLNMFQAMIRNGCVPTFSLLSTLSKRLPRSSQNTALILYYTNLLLDRAVISVPIAPSLASLDQTQSPPQHFLSSPEQNQLIEQTVTQFRLNLLQNQNTTQTPITFDTTHLQMTPHQRSALVHAHISDIDSLNQLVQSQSTQLHLPTPDPQIHHNHPPYLSTLAFPHVKFPIFPQLSHEHYIRHQNEFQLASNQNIGGIPSKRSPLTPQNPSEPIFNLANPYFSIPHQTTDSTGPTNSTNSTNSTDSPTQSQQSQSALTLLTPFDYIPGLDHFFTSQIQSTTSFSDLLHQKTLQKKHQQQLLATQKDTTHGKKKDKRTQFLDTRVDHRLPSTFQPLAASSAHSTLNAAEFSQINSILPNLLRVIDITQLPHHLYTIRRLGRVLSASEMTVLLSSVTALNAEFTVSTFNYLREMHIEINQAVKMHYFNTYEQQCHEWQQSLELNEQAMRYEEELALKNAQVRKHHNLEAEDHESIDSVLLHLKHDVKHITEDVLTHHDENLNNFNQFEQNSQHFSGASYILDQSHPHPIKPTDPTTENGEEIDETKLASKMLQINRKVQKKLDSSSYVTLSKKQQQSASFAEADLNSFDKSMEDELNTSPNAQDEELGNQTAEVEDQSKFNSQNYQVTYMGESLDVYKRQLHAQFPTELSISHWTALINQLTYGKLHQHLLSLQNSITFERPNTASPTLARSTSYNALSFDIPYHQHPTSNSDTSQQTAPPRASFVLPPSHKSLRDHIKIASFLVSNDVTGVSTLLTERLIQTMSDTTLITKAAEAEDIHSLSDLDHLYSICELASLIHHASSGVICFPNHKLLLSRYPPHQQQGAIKNVLHILFPTSPHSQTQQTTGETADVVDYHGTETSLRQQQSVDHQDSNHIPIHSLNHIPINHILSSLSSTPFSHQNQIQRLQKIFSQVHANLHKLAQTAEVELTDANTLLQNDTHSFGSDDEFGIASDAGFDVDTSNIVITSEHLALLSNPSGSNRRPDKPKKLSRKAKKQVVLQQKLGIEHAATSPLRHHNSHDPAILSSLFDLPQDVCDPISKLPPFQKVTIYDLTLSQPTYLPHTNYLTQSDLEHSLKFLSDSEPNQQNDQRALKEKQQHYQKQLKFLQVNQNVISFNVISTMYYIEHNLPWLGLFNIEQLSYKYGLVLSSTSVLSLLLNSLNQSGGSVASILYNHKNTCLDSNDKHIPLSNDYSASLRLFLSRILRLSFFSHYVDLFPNRPVHFQHVSMFVSSRMDSDWNQAKSAKQNQLDTILSTLNGEERHDKNQVFNDETLHFAREMGIDVDSLGFDIPAVKQQAKISPSSLQTNSDAHLLENDDESINILRSTVPGLYPVNQKVDPVVIKMNSEVLRAFVGSVFPNLPLFALYRISPSSSAYTEQTSNLVSPLSHPPMSISPDSQSPFARSSQYNQSEQLEQAKKDPTYHSAVQIARKKTSPIRDQAFLYSIFGLKSPQEVVSEYIARYHQHLSPNQRIDQRTHLEQALELASKGKYGETAGIATSSQPSRIDSNQPTLNKHQQQQLNQHCALLAHQQKQLLRQSLQNEWNIQVRQLLGHYLQGSVQMMLFVAQHSQLPSFIPHILNVLDDFSIPLNKDHIILCINAISQSIHQYFAGNQQQIDQQQAQTRELHRMTFNKLIKQIILHDFVLPHTAIMKIMSMLKYIPLTDGYIQKFIDYLLDHASNAARQPKKASSIPTSDQSANPIDVNLTRISPDIVKSILTFISHEMSKQHHHLNQLSRQSGHNSNEPDHQEQKNNFNYLSSQRQQTSEFTSWAIATASRIFDLHNETVNQQERTQQAKHASSLIDPAHLQPVSASKLITVDDIMFDTHETITKMGLLDLEHLSLLVNIFKYQPNQVAYETSWKLLDGYLEHADKQLEASKFTGKQMAFKKRQHFVENFYEYVKSQTLKNTTLLNLLTADNIDEKSIRHAFPQLTFIQPYSDSGLLSFQADHREKTLEWRTTMYERGCYSVSEELPSSEELHPDFEMLKSLPDFKEILHTPSLVGIDGAFYTPSTAIKLDPKSIKAQMDLQLAHRKEIEARGVAPQNVKHIPINFIPSKFEQITASEWRKSLFPGGAAHNRLSKVFEFAPTIRNVVCSLEFQYQLYVQEQLQKNFNENMGYAEFYKQFIHHNTKQHLTKRLTLVKKNFAQFKENDVIGNTPTRDGYIGDEEDGNTGIDFSNIRKPKKSNPPLSDVEESQDESLARIPLTLPKGTTHNSEEEYISHIAQLEQAISDLDANFATSKEKQEHESEFVSDIGLLNKAFDPDKFIHKHRDNMLFKKLSQHAISPTTSIAVINKQKPTNQFILNVLSLVLFNTAECHNLSSLFSMLEKHEIILDQDLFTVVFGALYRLPIDKIPFTFLSLANHMHKVLKPTRVDPFGRISHFPTQTSHNSDIKYDPTDFSYLTEIDSLSSNTLDYLAKSATAPGNDDPQSKLLINAPPPKSSHPDHCYVYQNIDLRERLGFIFQQLLTSMDSLSEHQVAAKRYNQMAQQLVFDPQSQRFQLSTATHSFQPSPNHTKQPPLTYKMQQLLELFLNCTKHGLHIPTYTFESLLSCALQEENQNAAPTLASIYLSATELFIKSSQLRVNRSPPLINRTGLDLSDTSSLLNNSAPLQLLGSNGSTVMNSSTQDHLQFDPMQRLLPQPKSFLPMKTYLNTTRDLAVQEQHLAHLTHTLDKYFTASPRITSIDQFAPRSSQPTSHFAINAAEAEHNNPLQLQQQFNEFRNVYLRTMYTAQSTHDLHQLFYGFPAAHDILRRSTTSNHVINMPSSEPANHPTAVDITPSGDLADSSIQDDDIIPIVPHDITSHGVDTTPHPTRQNQLYSPIRTYLHTLPDLLGWNQHIHLRSMNPLSSDHVITKNSLHHGPLLTEAQKRQLLTSSADNQLTFGDDGLKSVDNTQVPVSDRVATQDQSLQDLSSLKFGSDNSHLLKNSGTRAFRLDHASFSIEAQNSPAQAGLNDKQVKLDENGEVIEAEFDEDGNERGDELAHDKGFSALSSNAVNLSRTMEFRSSYPYMSTSTMTGTYSKHHAFFEFHSASKLPISFEILQKVMDLCISGESEPHLAYNLYTFLSRFISPQQISSTFILQSILASPSSLHRILERNAQMGFDFEEIRDELLPQYYSHPISHYLQGSSSSHTVNDVASDSASQPTPHRDKQKSVLNQIQHKYQLLRRNAAPFLFSVPTESNTTPTSIDALSPRDVYNAIITSLPSSITSSLNSSQPASLSDLHNMPRITPNSFPITSSPMSRAHFPRKPANSKPTSWWDYSALQPSTPQRSAIIVRQLLSDHMWRYSQYIPASVTNAAISSLVKSNQLLSHGSTILIHFNNHRQELIEQTLPYLDFISSKKHTQIPPSPSQTLHDKQTHISTYGFNQFLYALATPPQIPLSLSNNNSQDLSKLTIDPSSHNSKIDAMLNSQLCPKLSAAQPFNHIILAPPAQHANSLSDPAKHIEIVSSLLTSFSLQRDALLLDFFTSLQTRINRSTPTQRNADHERIMSALRRDLNNFNHSTYFPPNTEQIISAIAENHTLRGICSSIYTTQIAQKDVFIMSRRIDERSIEASSYIQLSSFTADTTKTTPPLVVDSDPVARTLKGLQLNQSKTGAVSEPPSTHLQFNIPLVYAKYHSSPREIQPSTCLLYSLSSSTSKPHDNSQYSNKPHQMHRSQPAGLNSVLSANALLPGKSSEHTFALVSQLRDNLAQIDLMNLKAQEVLNAQLVKLIYHCDQQSLFANPNDGQDSLTPESQFVQARSNRLPNVISLTDQHAYVLFDSHAHLPALQLNNILTIMKTLSTINQSALSSPATQSHFALSNFPHHTPVYIAPAVYNTILFMLDEYIALMKENPAQCVQIFTQQMSRDELFSPIISHYAKKVATSKKSTTKTSKSSQTASAQSSVTSDSLPDELKESLVIDFLQQAKDYIQHHGLAQFAFAHDRLADSINSLQTGSANTIEHYFEDLTLQTTALMTADEFEAPSETAPSTSPSPSPKLHTSPPKETPAIVRPIRLTNKQSAYSSPFVAQLSLIQQSSIADALHQVVQLKMGSVKSKTQPKSHKIRRLSADDDSGNEAASSYSAEDLLISRVTTPLISHVQYHVFPLADVANPISAQALSLLSTPFALHGYDTVESLKAKAESAGYGNVLSVEPLADSDQGHNSSLLHRLKSTMKARRALSVKKPTRGRKPANPPDTSSIMLQFDPNLIHQPEYLPLMIDNPPSDSKMPKIHQITFDQQSGNQHYRHLLSNSNSVFNATVPVEEYENIVEAQFEPHPSSHAKDNISKKKDQNIKLASVLHADVAFLQDTPPPLAPLLDVTDGKSPSEPRRDRSSSKHQAHSSETNEVSSLADSHHVDSATIALARSEMKMFNKPVDPQDVKRITPAHIILHLMVQSLSELINHQSHKQLAQDQELFVNQQKMVNSMVDKTKVKNSRLATTFLTPQAYTSDFHIISLQHTSNQLITATSKAIGLAPSDPLTSSVFTDLTALPLPRGMFYDASTESLPPHLNEQWDIAMQYTLSQLRDVDHAVHPSALSQSTSPFADDLDQKLAEMRENPNRNRRQTTIPDALIDGSVVWHLRSPSLLLQTLVAGIHDEDNREYAAAQTARQEAQLRELNKRGKGKGNHSHHDHSTENPFETKLSTQQLAVALQAQSNDLHAVGLDDHCCGNMITTSLILKKLMQSVDQILHILIHQLDLPTQHLGQSAQHNRPPKLVEARDAPQYKPDDIDPESTIMNESSNPNPNPNAGHQSSEFSVDGSTQEQSQTKPGKRSNSTHISSALHSQLTKHQYAPQSLALFVNSISTSTIASQLPDDLSTKFNVNRPHVAPVTIEFLESLFTFVSTLTHYANSLHDRDPSVLTSQEKSPQFKRATGAIAPLGFAASSGVRQSAQLPSSNLFQRFPKAFTRYLASAQIAVTIEVDRYGNSKILPQSLSTCEFDPNSFPNSSSSTLPHGTTLHVNPKIRDKHNHQFTEGTHTLILPCPGFFHIATLQYNVTKDITALEGALKQFQQQYNTFTTKSSSILSILELFDVAIESTIALPSHISNPNSQLQVRNVHNLNPFTAQIAMAQLPGAIYSMAKSSFQLKNYPWIRSLAEDFQYQLTPKPLAVHHGSKQLYVSAIASNSAPTLQLPVALSLLAPASSDLTLVNPRDALNLFANATSKTQLLKTIQSHYGLIHNKSISKLSSSTITLLLAHVTRWVPVNSQTQLFYLFIAGLVASIPNVSQLEASFYSSHPNQLDSSSTNPPTAADLDQYITNQIKPYFHTSLPHDDLIANSFHPGDDLRRLVASLPDLDDLVKSEYAHLPYRITTKISMLYATRLCEFKSRCRSQDELDKRYRDLSTFQDFFTIHKTLQQPISPRIVATYFDLLLGTVPPQLYGYRFNTCQVKRQQTLRNFAPAWAFVKSNLGLLPVYQQLLKDGVLDPSLPRLVHDLLQQESATSAFVQPESDEIPIDADDSANPQPFQRTLHKPQDDPRKHSYVGVFEEIANHIIYYDSKVLLSMLGYLCPAAINLPPQTDVRLLHLQYKEWKDHLHFNPDVSSDEIDEIVAAFLNLHNFRQQNASFHTIPSSRHDTLSFGGALLPVSQRTYRQITDSSSIVVQALDLSARDLETYYLLARAMFIAFPTNIALQDVMADLVDEIQTLTNSQDKFLPPTIFGEYSDPNWKQDQSLQAQGSLQAYKHRNQFLNFAGATTALHPSHNRLTQDLILRTSGLPAITLPGFRQNDSKNPPWYAHLYSEYPLPNDVDQFNDPPSSSHSNKHSSSTRQRGYNVKRAYSDNQYHPYRNPQQKEQFYEAKAAHQEQIAAQQQQQQHQREKRSNFRGKR